ncbi:MAG: hypothetical protein RBT45_02965 [Acholeplasmataceae bacterium]|jgi:hypothetical protein|nr:hypothetical protein [Acholeplasmataceae bacterium]
MEYNIIKSYVQKLIEDDLQTSYSLPAITNHYHNEDSFRLFFNVEDTSFSIDIEIDSEIDVKTLMIYGPMDLGPFDISKKNILKAIKFIKKYINSQYSIEYFDEHERLGEIIFRSKRDLSEKELNIWLKNRFEEGYFSNIADKKHPKGYTRIKKICTQYTFKGPKRLFLQKDHLFIEDLTTK